MQHHLSIFSYSVVYKIVQTPFRFVWRQPHRDMWTLDSRGDRPAMAWLFRVSFCHRCDTNIHRSDRICSVSCCSTIRLRRTSWLDLTWRTVTELKQLTIRGVNLFRLEQWANQCHLSVRWCHFLQPNHPSHDHIIMTAGCLRGLVCALLSHLHYYYFNLSLLSPKAAVLKRTTFAEGSVWWRKTSLHSRQSRANKHWDVF